MEQFILLVEKIIKKVKKEVKLLLLFLLMRVIMRVNGLMELKMEKVCWLINKVSIIVENGILGCHMDMEYILCIIHLIIIREAGLEGISMAMVKRFLLMGLNMQECLCIKKKLELENYIIMMGLNMKVNLKTISLMG